MTKIFFLDFFSDWILSWTGFCLGLRSAVVFRMQLFNYKMSGTLFHGRRDNMFNCFLTLTTGYFSTQFFFLRHNTFKYLILMCLCNLIIFCHFLLCDRSFYAASAGYLLVFRVYYERPMVIKLEQIAKFSSKVILD